MKIIYKPIDQNKDRVNFRILHDFKGLSLKEQAAKTVKRIQWRYPDANDFTWNTDKATGQISSGSFTTELNLTH